MLSSESENSEKIRVLLNKLQAAICDFKELKYTNKHLHFHFCKNHINVLSIISEDNETQKLSLKLFNSFFIGKEDFLECTKEKEDYINLIIQIINGDISDETLEDSFEYLIYYCEFCQEFQKLRESLSKLNIKAELIFMMVLYMIMNNDFSLNTLLDMLIPILREQFPDSLFNMENLIDSEISLNSFVEKFSNLCKKEKIDNYADINWDEKKKDFVVDYYSLDEITQIIFNVGYKKKHRKKKKKKGENKNIEEETKNQNDNLKNNDINQGHNNSSNNNSEILLKIMANNSLVNSESKKNKTENEEKRINNNIQEKSQKEVIADNAKDKDIKNNEITNELNITLIGKSENKINEISEAETDLKKKYDELLKEIQKMKENFIELKKTNNKKLKKLKKLSDPSESKINNLSGLLVNSTQRVEELDYNLKMIGLRTAYKAFVDLFIHILKIKENGNLFSKVDAIKTFMNKKNNKYTNKLIEMLDDLLDILAQSNNKAHYIDFKANLTSQLLEILGKYTKPHKYDIISEVINAFDGETLFKELVKLRTEKYKMDAKVYVSKETNILNKIRNNPSNEKGLNFLMSKNSCC